MHQVLLIREILLIIFGHCSPASHLERRSRADLAALARTCQTFKQPALDVLWETLFDLTPLARCVPEACKIDGMCYSFSRPPSEAEWNTLRGYTCRVRSIHKSLEIFDKRIILPSVPFTEPFFPNLRSLFWENFEALLVEHTAVPSLTSLSLGFVILSEPLLTELFDTFGERCPNIRKFSASFSSSGPLDIAISRQLGRWSNLQYADCLEVTLTTDFILRLPSLATLKRLSFTLSADLGTYTTHHGSVFALSSLANLNVKSPSLKSVTTLFSRIQLPKIKDLRVFVSEYTPKRYFREYWTILQKACSSNTLFRLVFVSTFDIEIEALTVLDEPENHPCLTLHDLLPCKDFGNLHTIDIDIPWSVNLSDTDVLDLVSTSPHLEALDINRRHGWKMDSQDGITLSGLVQLLRQCPSLGTASLVIDTRTFTRIPDGLDVSFPPRKSFFLDCLDSHEAHPDCEGVFEALKLNVYFGMMPRARI